MRDCLFRRKSVESIIPLALAREGGSVGDTRPRSSIIPRIAIGAPVCSLITVTVTVTSSGVLHHPPFLHR